MASCAVSHLSAKVWAARGPLHNQRTLHGQSSTRVIWSNWSFHDFRGSLSISHSHHWNPYQRMSSKKITTWLSLMSHLFEGVAHYCKTVCVYFWPLKCSTRVQCHAQGHLSSNCWLRWKWHVIIFLRICVQTWRIFTIIIRVHSLTSCLTKCKLSSFHATHTKNTKNY